MSYGGGGGSDYGGDGGTRVGFGRGGEHDGYGGAGEGHDGYGGAGGGHDGYGGAGGGHDGCRGAGGGHDGYGGAGGGHDGYRGAGGGYDDRYGEGGGGAYYDGYGEDDGGGGGDVVANIRGIEWTEDVYNQLPRFEKSFYFEHPLVKNRSKAEVRAYREEHDISVRGDDCPNPTTVFEESGFPEYVLSDIKRCGFTEPTLIQGQSWPVALSGRDVIGIAPTGSGKTCAYILPAVVHINAQPYLEKGDGPIVLVLAPTRELAERIKNECNKFGPSSRITCSCVYGGASERAQANGLERGVEILIATPGCLIDFLVKGTTNLSRVTYLVLDEADRMFGMGFEKQLRQIIGRIRPDRQTLVFTATWPNDVAEIANEFLNEKPVTVQIGNKPPTVILLVGLQASGKTSFASRLVKHGWVGISQCELGSREACVHKCRIALKTRHNIVIDRCNFDAEQRSHWITIARSERAYVGAVVFDVPLTQCVERARNRPYHPTLPPGDEAAGIVRTTAKKWKAPTLGEGIGFFVTIRNDDDVEQKYHELLGIIAKPLQ